MTDGERPQDHVIDMQDVEGCGWSEIVDLVDQPGYMAIASAFTEAAAQADRDARPLHARALRLFGKACWLDLKPRSANQPFTSIFVPAGAPQNAPLGFHPDDVALLAQIIDELNNPWLKGRVAHLVWHLQQPRDVRFAQRAIDAYLSIPLNIDSWIQGGRESWHQAALLTKLIGDVAADRIASIESAIVTAFSYVSANDGFFDLRMAQFLKAEQLGTAEAPMIAAKLESRALELEKLGKRMDAADYLREAAAWYRAAGNEEQALTIIIMRAETAVRQGEARVSGGDGEPSFRAAAYSYREAIEAYREIPRAARADRGLEERIDGLRIVFSDARERAQDEMVETELPGVDISKQVRTAQNAVRGRTPLEALAAFANLVRGPIRSQLLENALDESKQSLFRSLMTVARETRDGRRVGSTSPPPPGTPMPEDDPLIRSRMIDEYHSHVQIAAQACILPAQQVLVLEHRLSDADFMMLAAQSPFVPPRREIQFGKGLFAGYDYDFITAIHLLVPQIEHAIRAMLASHGVTTTTLMSDGIEHVMNLGRLLDLPEAKELLGEDMHFEILVLFCDPVAEGLRNEVAHGLLDDGDAGSTLAVYAWWLALRLVFDQYWHATHSIRDQPTTVDTEV